MENKVLQAEENLSENGSTNSFRAGLEEVSRSYIQKLIKEGHVSVNGKPVKANL